MQLLYVAIDLMNLWPTPLHSDCGLFSDLGFSLWLHSSVAFRDCEDKRSVITSPGRQKQAALLLLSPMLIAELKKQSVDCLQLEEAEAEHQWD